MPEMTEITVSPIAGFIGAEISGLDLRQALRDDEVAAVRKALLDWKVVFFRDQHISRGEHVAFGRRFGEVTPAHPTLPARFADHPEILLLEHQANEPGGVRIESRWHTDVTFLERPPMASILRGVELPDHGGDTQWVNTVVAYERLSPLLQDLCDHLHAVHRNTIHVERGELDSGLRQQFMSKDISAVHPVVRVHPETGERALFVNPGFTDHIVELSRAESRHLLALLYEHMTNTEYSCRFRWRPGSIAFWDNRATMHIVPTDVPAGERRSMERITIAGDAPVGPA